MSVSVPTAIPSSAARADRAFAWLLGLHGLALLVVFPLGPQEARLWHPGVPGVAALAAAFPLAAALSCLLARRLPRLPSSPRTLAGIAFISLLPGAFSFDYPTLVAARILSGLAIGLSYVAIHRVLPTSASPAIARLTPRIVAFGMPVCLFASTALDWRFGFAPILLGQLFVFARAPRHAAPVSASETRAPVSEPSPWSLVATSALAAVTAAYLTVLSGFLVFNAGHTEFHIPAVLLTTALLGLAAPPLVGRLRAKTNPATFYLVTLAASGCALLALLALQTPLPAPLALLCIATFLVVNSTRHLALARLVSPALPPDRIAAHQTHTQLAHHLGFGLGALAAGQLIFLTPRHTFGGMPALFTASLASTALALFAGLAAHRAAQPKAMPKPAEMPANEMRAPS